MLASGAAAAAADADPIAGATYNGVAADGATVTFTVSSDGTLVDSYKVSGVHVGACQFVGEGDTGIWPGAPIANDAFEYQFYDAILFAGTFPGAQSASGTFRFYDPATSETAACDTGSVSWTATTTATPPSSGSGGGSGTGTGSGSGTGTGAGSGSGTGTGTGSGSGGGTGTGTGTGTGSGTGTGTPPGTGGRRTPSFATRVALRRLSGQLLAGRIHTPSAACRAGRRVTLWRGSRRIASTRSKADGEFSFDPAASLRGHSVRASVAARAVRSGLCAAGSSTFIAG